MPSVPSKFATTKILPLRMDSRCEAAIRLHAALTGWAPDRDAWAEVKADAEKVYRFLIRNTPNLYGEPGQAVIDAPINNGVIHPLTCMTGVAVTFMMIEGIDPNSDFEVAATFWIAGSVIRA